MKTLALTVMCLLSACGGGANNAAGNGNPANTAGGSFKFSGDDTASPQDVVFAMETARREKDNARVRALLSKEDLASAKKTDEVDEVVNAFEIGDAKIDGDTATVNVTYTKPSGETGPPMTWHCIKEDGKWKLRFMHSFMELFKGASSD